MAPRRLEEAQIRQIVMYPKGRDAKNESEEIKTFRADLERCRMDLELLALWNEYCFQWETAGNVSKRLTIAMTETLRGYGNGTNNGLRRRVIAALKKWCDEHPVQESDQPATAPAELAQV